MSLLFGRKNNTLKEIEAVRTPDMTDSHHPVAHITVIKMIKACFKLAGLKVTEQQHQLDRGGLRYFGGFALEGEGLTSADKRMVVGLRNSHDKAFALGVCAGVSMVVCDNLWFNSDEKMTRRHTKQILRDMNRVLSNAVARIRANWSTMEDRIEAYKTIKITRQMAADLLVSLVDAKAFTARDIYPTIKEFEAPGFSVATSKQYADLSSEDKAAQVIRLDESHGGGTLWTLHNAITENLKGGNLSLLPHRTITVNSILDGLASFTPPVIDLEAEAEVIDIESAQA
jgi:hypothetical protein